MEERPISTFSSGSDGSRQPRGQPRLYEQMNGITRTSKLTTALPSLDPQPKTVSDPTIQCADGVCHTPISESLNVCGREEGPEDSRGKGICRASFNPGLLHTFDEEFVFGWCFLVVFFFFCFCVCV